MANLGSPTNCSIDSSNTLRHSDLDEQLAILEYRPIDGKDLPDPDYFDQLLEDIDCPLRGPPLDMPAVEDIVWGHLPSADQFEVDGESKEPQALDSHHERIHAETYLQTIAGAVDGPNAHCTLNVLRLKRTPHQELAAIVVYSHKANIMRGLEGRCTPAGVATIVEARINIPVYGEVLLEKIFDKLDKCGVHLTTYYSRSGHEMTHSSAWVHEPIPQLRIRIRAPAEDRLEDFGAMKITWQRLKGILAQDGAPQNGRLAGHSRPTDACASLFIQPSISAGRQVQLAYQTDSLTEQDRQRFTSQHNLGAASNLSFPQGSTAWLSWIDDGRAGALRVNRVVVSRSSGLTRDLVGLLNHCIDQADVHYTYDEVIVWDPPPEMWDAALALADDAKHGARYEVYKEEVKDLKCFVRWNPMIREKIVWQRKQFYCFPSSWQGRDWQY